MGGAYDLEPIDTGELNLAERFGIGAEPEVKKHSDVEGFGMEAQPMQKLEHEQQGESLEETLLKSKESLQASVAVKPVNQDDKDEVAAVSQGASDIHQITDRESQLQHLLDLATTQGVEHAVKVAQHLEDYYVLDQLHDKLMTEEFHKMLVERGMIDEG